MLDFVCRMRKLGDPSELLGEQADRHVIIAAAAFGALMIEDLLAAVGALEQHEVSLRLFPIGLSDRFHSLILDLWTAFEGSAHGVASALGLSVLTFIVIS